MPTFNHGGYQVDVALNGAIKVQFGDSLSKYSMAIHHDFNNMDKFARDVNGKITTIPEASRNLIYAGETIYYTGNKLPSTVKPTPGSGDPGVPLTHEQKLALLEELKERHNLTHEQWETMRWIVLGSSIGQRVGTLGVIATEASTVLSSSVTVGAISAGVGILGALLVPVGGVIGLALARNFGVSQFSVKSIAYNITYWAYKTGGPPTKVLAPPRFHLEMLEKTVPQDMYAYYDGWEQAGRQTFQSLENFHRQEKVSRLAIQLLYQSIGKGQPTVTCRKLMEKLCQQYYSRTLDRDSFMTPAPGYPIQ